MPETREKTGSGDLVPPPVPPSMAILEPEAEELLAIWTALDRGGRDDLLAVARGLVVRCDGVV